MVSLLWEPSEESFLDEVKTTPKTIPAKAPTCIDTGLTEGMKCTICDTMVLPQTVIPTTDCMEFITLHYMAPTCQASGLTEGSKCKVCGKIIVPQEEIPVVDCVERDDWSIVIPATKITNGKAQKHQ